VVDGGWPGSCHKQELIELAGLEQVLDGVEVASLLDRGFRGLAKAREHWHAPVGDRLTDAQRAFNRAQAGLRAIVEQAIGHLAGAWALRSWRRLLDRVRDVYRAAATPLPQRRRLLEVLFPCPSRVRQRQLSTILTVGEPFCAAHGRSCERKIPC
jgi:DDE superfamily endonuclease